MFHDMQRVRALSLASVALVGLLFAAVSGSAAAADLKDLDCSVTLVPHDVSFYSASLKNREQIEAIGQSRAWQKLMEMPWVQMGLAMYRLQTVNEESVPGQIEKALNDPANRELIDFAVDALSHEVFLCGDKEFTNFLNLMVGLNSVQSLGPAKAVVSGQMEEFSEDLQQRMILEYLAKNAGRLRVPGILAGFRVEDKPAAEKVLAQLETQLSAVVGMLPEGQERVQREKVGETEYIVVRLDGSMIPWEKVDIDDMTESGLSAEDAKKLIEAGKGAKLVVALGVRGDYLLFSLGRSLELLESLGSDRSLADRPEMKRLAPHADRNVLGIGYVSREFMQAADGNQENLKALKELADLAAGREEVPVELGQRIRKDAEAMYRDVETLLPQHGALAQISYSTDAGIESYGYNWAKHPQLDGSKPLTLLNHVGGQPLLAVVARGKSDPQVYERLVHWLKVGWSYFEEFGKPQIPAAERKPLDEFLEKALPALQQIDQTNRELLIPALEDGQSALVIDAKLASRRFHEVMPQSKTPLPMIEPAILVGVSDAAKLREACQKHGKSIGAIIAAARETFPEEFPEQLRLPEGVVAKAPGGTIRSYPMPEEWGVDKKIAFSLGLRDDVAVAAASVQHARRLMRPTPLAAAGVLEDADRPRAVAVVFDFHVLIEAVRPWIDYAVAQRGSGDDEEELQAIDDEDGTDEILAQVNTILDVLKALQRVTSESYFEGDALVTHSLMEVGDIAE